ncbi:MAG TPA: hypothetical protein VKY74_27735 [Chloroflexia bacterium]|nr:hypothetical protein [Chloroflexia bacterium]
MPGDKLVAYLGPANIHDGVVVAMQRQNGLMQVTIRGVDGQEIIIEFSGVESVTAHRAEGMMVYALAEMASPPPARRFVFVNWDDEDEARLEIAARAFQVVAT